MALLTLLLMAITTPDSDMYVNRVHPLKTKGEVVQAKSMKILLDNRAEFKKKQLFMDVATQLSVEGRVFSPPYHCHSNGRIKGFHHFFKTCMAKHVSKSLEWDQVVPLTCTAYNFLPSEHSKENPFFPMFGKHTIVPLNVLLTPTVRYLGTDENILSLEALRNMYQLIASNLKQAERKRDTTSPIPDRKFSDGDSVLLKDHTASVWDPRYTRGY